MSVDVFVAAKTLGEACGWRVPNLRMQKILYFAHLDYMGKYNERLIESPFEAWEYGPVQPALFHKLKRFGARYVRDVFFREEPLTEGKEFDVLRSASELWSAETGVLVAFTYNKDGAWIRTCNKGMLGHIIPDKLIREEYDMLAGGAGS